MRLGLLLPLVIAAAAAAVALLPGSTGPDVRHATVVEAAGGTDFEFDVKGASGCDSAGKATQCDLGVGQTLTLYTSVNSFQGIMDQDGDTKVGYSSVQVDWQWDVAGIITVKNAAIVWPECGLPQAGAIGATGFTTPFGCAVGVGANESTFVGNVLRADVNCDAEGSVVITMPSTGTEDTHLVGEDVKLALDSNPADSIEIKCFISSTPTATPTASPVGGIAGLPAVAEPSAEAVSRARTDNSGLSAGGVAAGGVAAAMIVAFGVGAWYARRRPLP